MKVLFISRRTVRGFAVAAMLLSIWMISINLMRVQGISITASAQQKSIPIYSVDTNEKIVAVTFDAAWGNDSTESILDLLDEYQVKSTFFLVGYWVDANPNLVKEIVNRGHEIGNHSLTHPHVNQLSSEEIVKELSNNSAKINSLVDQPVTLFRPPYGEWNENVVSTARDAGYQVVQWDTDTLDWKGLSPNEMLKRVEKNLTNGSIVLFHNNSEHILQGLKTILPYIAEQGYAMVKVSDLIYSEPYTVDSNGRQHASVQNSPTH